MRTPDEVYISIGPRPTWDDWVAAPVWLGSVVVLAALFLGYVDDAVVRRPCEWKSLLLMTAFACVLVGWLFVVVSAIFWRFRGREEVHLRGAQVVIHCQASWLRRSKTYALDAGETLRIAERRVRRLAPSRRLAFECNGRTVFAFSSLSVSEEEFLRDELTRIRVEESAAGTAAAMSGNARGETETLSRAAMVCLTFASRRCFVLDARAVAICMLVALSVMHSYHRAWWPDFGVPPLFVSGMLYWAWSATALRHSSGGLWVEWYFARHRIDWHVVRWVSWTPEWLGGRLEVVLVDGSAFRFTSIKSLAAFATAAQQYCAPASPQVPLPSLPWWLGPTSRRRL